MTTESAETPDRRNVASSANQWQPSPVVSVTEPAEPACDHPRVLRTSRGDEHLWWCPRCGARFSPVPAVPAEPAPTCTLCGGSAVQTDCEACDGFGNPDPAPLAETREAAGLRARIEALYYAAVSGYNPSFTISAHDLRAALASPPAPGEPETRPERRAVLADIQRLEDMERANVISEVGLARLDGLRRGLAAAARITPEPGEQFTGEAARAWVIGYQDGVSDALPAPVPAVPAEPDEVRPFVSTERVSPEVAAGIERIADTVSTARDVRPRFDDDPAPVPLAETREAAELRRALARWAADQRERQAWGDRDANTYRYRADLLEAAVAALSAPPAPTAAEGQR